jgi:hypothetical protein
MEVGDDDSGVIPALPANDLAASEGVDSPESGLQGQRAVDPTRIQIREVQDRQLGSDGCGGLSY